MLQKQVLLPIIWIMYFSNSVLATQFCMFAFYFMLSGCLCVSCSYLFHIFSPFSLPFHHPSSISQFSINLFFYLNILFASSSTVSYFSCLLPILPSLSLSVIQLFQSSILMFSPSSAYLWHICFQSPRTFLHSAPILSFSLSSCLLCTGSQPALLRAEVI